MRICRPRRIIVLALTALVVGLVPPPTATAQTASATKCKNGMAGEFPCHRIDLMSQVPAAVTGGASVADVWGWVDPETKKEYAILGTSLGVQFFDVSNPKEPVYLGNLPLKFPDGSLIWQELEILNDTAYIVCDIDPCGLQIFDLNRLRGVESAMPLWLPDAVVPIGFAHTIDSNPATNHIFLNGAGATGAPLIFDVSDPLFPVPVGVTVDDGYTHDSLCRNYRGPDKDYKGHEICFNFNGFRGVTIFDVTADPQRPVLLSRNRYETLSYVHSGALTKDHSTLISTDEGDEWDRGLPTTLYIWDVRNLVKPRLIGMWHARSNSTDHNVYSEANALFHANYTNGFRILDLKKAHEGKLREVAWFDTVPTDDTPAYSGAWAVYPFLPSGNILVGNMSGGLLIVRPQAGVLKSLGIKGKRPTMSSL